MNEDVQYKRMCSINQAHLQYEQGCEVHASRSSNFGQGGHYSKCLGHEKSFVKIVGV